MPSRSSMRCAAEALAGGATEVFELRASDGPLAAGARGLEAFLDRFGCGERVRFVSALIVEEALGNLFLRAPNPPAHCRLTCAIEPGTGSVLITLEDPGDPFDPCQFPAPEPVADIAMAADGGRGILLMRSMSDEMFYQRVNGLNRLTCRVCESPQADVRRSRRA
ncbi:MAG: ATP-binding protein [Rhodocyclaceae bacterium]|nr:ATP-binding protein [Rhodocyclaceae bacterium]